MDIAEAVRKALGEHGDAIRAFHEKNMAEITGLKTKITDLEKKGGSASEIDELKASLGARVLEIEQKYAKKPGGGGMNGSEGETSAARQIADSLIKALGAPPEEFTKSKSRRIEIGADLSAQVFTKAMVNATGSDQPLVQADRRNVIVSAPQRRFTVRDLLQAVPTQSNVVEFARETLFTNNAGVQGAGSSPAESEGQMKNESSMAFELVQAPVVTIAHFVTTSRQLLADAALLERYISARLMFGLKVAEEEQLLSGSGVGGNLSGLVHNATAFAGGSTNQTALDTIALSIAQLVTNSYEPSGIIISPTDWYSSKFLLAKNNQGEYLLGDPGSMAEPRLWGIPVAVSPSITTGKFMTIDGPRAGYIIDREGASVRMSDSHSDCFVRNLLALLCENRVGIAIEQSAAIVYGDLLNVG